MKLKLYNTMGRAVQDFEPLTAGLVGMYACGPTVYNYAHIGNLRTYLFEDILRRVLEYTGYHVKHVMNITDVGHLTGDAEDGEDKMLKSSREMQKSVWEIAEYFTNAFFKDIDLLNIKRPSVACKATEHIDDMIALIQRLEKNGYTYFSGGNLYFNIDKYEEYGKLALLENQNLQDGARIEVDENKKNPRDFVLWFTKSKFENQVMVWDSPWGKGYPGWHVECSAMSMKYLGEQFDIHCGGSDLVPVHHTNEIAQSEAATGKKWVNYWIHGEFLVLDKGKMAKSAGNFITLSNLIEKGYNPLDYRYFCLGGHYRSHLTFSFEALDGAKAARNNLIEKLKELKKQSSPIDEANLDQKASRYLENFKNHLSVDLHAPRALAEMWQIIKDRTIPPGHKLTAVYEMDKVFGLRLLEEVRVDDQDQGELSAEMYELINEREKAREDRNFKRADEIRNILYDKGIVIKDTPQGTKWNKKV